MTSYHAKTDLLPNLEANGVHQEQLQTALGDAISNRGNGSKSFTTTLETEVRRIQKFVQDQEVALELYAKILFHQANGIVGMASGPGGRSVQEKYAALHDLKRVVRKTVDDWLALQDFLTKHRRILLDMATKGDEKLEAGQHVKMVYDRLPTPSLHSAMVCVVSDIYHALRQAEEMIINQSNGNTAAGGDTVWQAPSSFQRSTTKYWVKDENLTKLMLTCAYEAPLLIYGKKGPLTSTDRNAMKQSDGDKLWDSLATRITSIYFDSADMGLYRERLKRAEGAQLLRARWYGDTMPTGDKIIFVELKTHHEKWVAQKSVKERASIMERDMVHFLKPVRWTKDDAQQMILRAKPKMKPEELPKAIDLLMRMHHLVVEHRLTACVRSVYDRAAFQSSKSNDLRLTLDRNVTLVNERVMQFDGLQQWCLTDSEAQTAQASVVPFNVFEVKLASDDPMPTGLAAALSDGTIEQATKFSKFLTGAAAFNSVSTLPYWAAHPAFYSFFDLDKRTAANNNSNSDDDANQGDYNLMNSSGEMAAAGGIQKLPKGVTIAPKNPARIEPKTYFANERTFVQWISASMLLLNISGYMLSAGHYNKTAAVISFSALGLVIYSSYLYFRRLNLLKDREPYGYFNKVNPIFLTSVVGVAIFLVWADSLGGDDFMNIFSFNGGETDRRFLRSVLSRPSLQPELFAKCPQEIVQTSLHNIVNPSSLVVDLKSHAFLTTSGDSIFLQPRNDSGMEANSLIRIHDSHLRDLATVGDRLFAVSDGPERTELLELTWWETPDDNEKLRIAGRWTLEESRSYIDGFTFVPSPNSPSSESLGSFYVNIDSLIHVYSVPTSNGNQESGIPDHPVMLKSLNMKVLSHGLALEHNGEDGELSTMTTFEGITYILRPNTNVLEAWNMTAGTLDSEIVLPSMKKVTKWSGFALERKHAENTGNPNDRGGDSSATGSDAVFLHLMANSSGESKIGGQIWSFPVQEDIASGSFVAMMCTQ